jgi:ketosteroid isomerase-like protein
MHCAAKGERGEEDMKAPYLAATMALLAVPAMAQTAANAPEDVAAIKAFEQANAEQNDASVLSQAYAADAVVLDYMTGGIYTGRAAIRDAMAKQIAPIKSVRAEIREHNIVTSPGFACDMQTTDFHYETRDGKTGVLSLRQMDAIKKIDGRWQIVQEQVAALNDPKTGNAVMTDLPTRGDKIWPADFGLGAPMAEDKAREQIKTWTDVSLRVVGIDAIMPFYGPGENELVQYGPTVPGNVRSKSEMYAYYAPSMNSFVGLETKTPVLKIDTDGLLGAQIDVQDITMHLKNGKTQALYWRQSDCVRRVGDKWYGVLNMSSFPTDLKTGKTDSRWAEFPVNQ